LVHVMDWIPSLADLAGVDVLEGAAADGVSFAEVARDPDVEGPRTEVFVERYEQDASKEKGGSPSHVDVSVITRRYKLRRSSLSHRWQDHLYDLDSDPEERSPLDLSSDENKAIHARLAKLLDELPPRR